MPPGANTDDHDRLITLEGSVSALVASVGAQGENANALHHALQRGAERESAQVERRIAEMQNAMNRISQDVVTLRERFDSRVRDSDQMIGELRVVTMPRSEINALLDALSARLDLIVNHVTDISRLLTSLESSASGQQVGAENARKQSERTRNWVIGLGTLVVAVITVVVIYVTSRQHNSTNPTSPATTITAPSR